MTGGNSYDAGCCTLNAAEKGSAASGSERQLAGRPHVRFEDGAHLFERVVVLLRRIRCDAVGWDDQLQVAHIGVVGAEEHAVVSCDASQNDRADFKTRQQQVERRPVEGRMLRLEYEIVV